MGLADVYYHYNTELADPRTNDWWLIPSPLPLIMIVACYLYFVLVCGPNYMQDRKPYLLKTFLAYYNIFQIIVNAWIVYRFLTGGWLTHLTLGCEPPDYSLNPMALQQADTTWWNMILKLIELSETAVFVFRKKSNQISFLHLYHHVTTFFVTWVSVKYFAGGMCTFPILLNSCVHVIMYTYYFLSSRGPKVQALIKYIKPYITIIQITQFFVLLTHSVQALMPTCDVSTNAAMFYVGNLLMNLVLFTNFYRRNYMSAKKTV